MSLRALTLVGATLAALAFPVAAEAARTTGSVNLRTGPSTGYGVITALPPGIHVGVGQCVPGWCQVNANGLSGWISSSYIAAGPPRYVAYPPPPPPRYYYRPAYPQVVYPRAYPRYQPYASPYAYAYAYPYPYPHQRRYPQGPGANFSYSGPGYGVYFNFGPGGRRW